MSSGRVRETVEEELYIRKRKAVEVELYIRKIKSKRPGEMSPGLLKYRGL